MRGRRRLAVALAAPAIGLGLALALGCSWVRPGERPAWEQPPPPAPDAPVIRPGSLHRSELANGLRVLILEDHRLPRVVLGVTVRRGEAGVDPDRAGLAAFTSELMKRGAGDRDALALAEAVDEIGASLGAGSDWDSMSVDVFGLSRDLDRLLAILSDVVLRPRFDPAEASRERSETLAALEKAKDDPETLGAWYRARAVYDGHRYGLPAVGIPETVDRLDAAGARRFHAQMFVPNNATLSVSGDVDPADMLERIGAAFGAWEPGPVPEPGPRPPEVAPDRRKIVLVDRPDLVQARIALSHEGMARTDPDRIALSLLNSVLGGSGFSSRLMSTIRSEAGLTYGVSSSFSLRRTPGPFVVSTFTRVSEVRRVLDLLLSELERARAEPPSAQELSDAQALAVGSFGLGLETSAAVMSALVDLDVYDLPQDGLDTYRGRVRAVTPEDTARLARERLHPERVAIVLVGPAEELVPQVEDLGPIEIVRP
jgi:zinc protease